MMRGGARQFDMVLNKHSIVKDGDDGRAKEFPIFIKTRIVEDDVVGLPKPGRAADINQRRVLPVHGGSLPIGVNLAMDRVDDLDFVKRRQKDTTIAGIESLPRHPFGRRPLDVQLTVAKGLLCVDVSRLRNDFEVTLPNFPCRRFALGPLPLREVLTVEQDNSVRRGLARLVLGAGIARCDDRRLGPVHIVNLPPRQSVRLSGSAHGYADKAQDNRSRHGDGTYV